MRHEEIRGNIEHMAHGLATERETWIAEEAAARCLTVRELAKFYILVISPPSATQIGMTLTVCEHVGLQRKQIRNPFRPLSWEPWEDFDAIARPHV